MISYVEHHSLLYFVGDHVSDTGICLLPQVKTYSVGPNRQSYKNRHRTRRIKQMLSALLDVIPTLAISLVLWPEICDEINLFVIIFACNQVAGSMTLRATDF
jgi:hypothetical protein